MNERASNLLTGIEKRDIRSLSKAITLLESSLQEDALDANDLLDACSQLAQKEETHRIAITGVPGVGKSTFIEVLGLRYIAQGKRVAVLAIDPSSSRTSGSILGDKTRMERLSTEANAFIRPSAAAHTLGGVASKTREAIVLCEAAGFDVIIIETVGVGQSETAVRDMSDTFVLMMLAGAGDELQGIKRGIMEMADVMLINKVEEANLAMARSAKSEYRMALHMLGEDDYNWNPEVYMMSALHGTGIEEALHGIEIHKAFINFESRQSDRRAKQNITWFDEAMKVLAYQRFYAQAGLRERIAEMREMVAAGKKSPLAAARALNQA
jgi:LAO/AO transport system kinase